ncbi:MAG: hypothetical protein CMF04_11255 [Hyphomonas sp.]|nr:hypothetical protein [Hyphomonas sp.]|tara:strand:- start:100 stop:573 length:474 start_codon:yes stop_codon:yes gene_type:complete
MQYEITQPGVYDSKGKPVKVGTVFDIKGDTVPAWLVNKGRRLGGDTEGKTPITNPKKDARSAEAKAKAEAEEKARLEAEAEAKAKAENTKPSAQERQQRLRELVGEMKPEAFTADGSPDVKVLNGMLKDGEMAFTAEERDQLWPGIKGEFTPPATGK